MKRLTEKQESRLWWASRILVLVTAVAGTVAAFGFMPPLGSQVAGAVAALAGVGSRWCEQHLAPVTKEDAL